MPSILLPVYTGTSVAAALPRPVSRLGAVAGRNRLVKSGRGTVAGSTSDGAYLRLSASQLDAFSRERRTCSAVFSGLNLRIVGSQERTAHTLKRTCGWSESSQH